MEGEQETKRPILNIKRKPHNRKTKTILVFDEAARKDYLTGFRKRKNERRKKAQEENTKKMKLEKQVLKQQMKEMIMKSDRYRVPEMEQLLDSTIYDLPEHTVTVTDITEIDLHGSRLQGPQNDNEKAVPTEKTQEDAEEQRKKKKQLVHKLSKVGNKPSSKKNKFKRPGKFKGGKGKSKDMSHHSRGKGDKTSRGKGDKTSRGKGDKTSRGKGDKTSRGKGDKTSRGKGDKMSRGKGDKMSRGKGDRKGKRSSSKKQRN